MIESIIKLLGQIARNTYVFQKTVPVYLRPKPSQPSALPVYKLSAADPKVSKWD